MSKNNLTKDIPIKDLLNQVDIKVKDKEPNKMVILNKSNKDFKKINKKFCIKYNINNSSNEQEYLVINNLRMKKLPKLKEIEEKYIRSNIEIGNITDENKISQKLLDKLEKEKEAFLEMKKKAKKIEAKLQSSNVFSNSSIKNQINKELFSYDGVNNLNNKSSASINNNDEFKYLPRKIIFFKGSNNFISKKYNNNSQEMNKVSPKTTCYSQNNNNITSDIFAKNEYLLDFNDKYHDKKISSEMVFNKEDNTNAFIKKIDGNSLKVFDEKSKSNYSNMNVFNKSHKTDYSHNRLNSFYNQSINNHSVTVTDRIKIIEKIKSSKIPGQFIYKDRIRSMNEKFNSLIVANQNQKHILFNNSNKSNDLSNDFIRLENIIL